MIVNTKYHHYHQNIIIIIRPSEQWEHAGAATWFSDSLPTESSKQARELSLFKMQMNKFYNKLMTFSIPLLATEDSQKASVSWIFFLFYIIATGASFHPATSFVAEKLMQEKLYEVSFVALPGRGDVHTVFKRRSSFVTLWFSCLLIMIHWKKSSRAMLRVFHLTIRSCH